MIYLFHGTEVEKVRSKAFAWVAAARAKEPNLVYARLAREEITAAALEEAASAGGLFVSRLLVLLDDPFPKARAASEDGDDEDEAISSIVEDYLEPLAASDNAIIILAPSLPAAKVKKISLLAKHVYTFDAPVAREASGFNSNLVNALANRSRAALWLEINRAMIAGDAPEKLHGLLHWKARDLMAKGSRIWNPEQSRTLSLDLIELLQSSRRGGLALDLALEKFALSI